MLDSAIQVSDFQSSQFRYRLPDLLLRATITFPLIIMIALVFGACDSTKILPGDQSNTPEDASNNEPYEGPNGTVVVPDVVQSVVVSPGAAIANGDPTIRDISYLGSEAVPVDSAVKTERNVQGIDGVIVDTKLSPPARHLRRMSARQLHNSITYATGQTWSEFDTFSGVLGKPNYVDSMEEDLSVSVGFLKLVGDAARATCSAAVNSGGGSKGKGIIMAKLSAVDKPTKASSISNLKYLFSRFLGITITDNNDERLQPFIRAIDGTLMTDNAANFSVAAGEVKNRWTAACVALIMHPDFYSY